MAKSDQNVILNANTKEHVILPTCCGQIGYTSLHANTKILRELSFYADFMAKLEKNYVPIFFSFILWSFCLVFFFLILFQIFWVFYLLLLLTVLGHTLKFIHRWMAKISLQFNGI